MNKERYGVIYLITNKIDNNKYVGQTTKSIEKRFNEHCFKSSGCTYLSRAIQKHGKENFIIEEIDYANSREELDEKEFYWIKNLDTRAPKGYNIREGGEVGVMYLDKHPMSIKIINIETREVYNSIKEASKKTGIDNSCIAKACKGKLETAGGYNWVYYEDFLNGNYEINTPKGTTKKVINLDTGKVFNSVVEASKYYNLNRHNIGGTCRGVNHTCGGYRWAYLSKDDENEQAL